MRVYSGLEYLPNLIGNIFIFDKWYNFLTIDKEIIVKMDYKEFEKYKSNFIKGDWVDSNTIYNFNLKTEDFFGTFECFPITIEHKPPEFRSESNFILITFKIKTINLKEPSIFDKLSLI